MDINALLNRRRDCLADEAPPCARVCPLGLDVREFISKLRSGMPGAAYKIYQKAALLPGVACHLCGEPCAASCARGALDASISMRRLELFCWRESHAQKAAVFHINDKKKRVLVVGGGPTGLGCAARLARWGYSVTLAESSGRLGGRLWRTDEARLPREVLLEDIGSIAALPYVTLALNRQVSQYEFKDYDAVLIATGADGQDYAGAEALQPAVFRAGSLVHPGQDILSSLYQGGQEAYPIEDYIKVGRFLQRENTAAAGYAFQPDLSRTKPAPSAMGSDPADWTKEAAANEAKRCILCSCANCYNACEMLRYYKRNAQKFMEDTSDSINKFFWNKNRALAPIMSCTQCGACQSVCPADIDLAKLCVETRRLLHERGKLPDGYYDYWINDMRHACGDGAAVALAPGGGEAPRFVFFPGCQLGAAEPSLVRGAWSWLESAFPGQMAALVQCCGAPARWAGLRDEHEMVLSGIRAHWERWGRPVFVLACPTCAGMFSEHLPDIQTTTLWRLMAAKAETQPTRGAAVSVFDPCASREDAETRAAIRLLINKAGYDIAELPVEPEQTRCCGYGGLISPYNEDLAGVIRKHNRDLGEAEYITYCANCRDSFILAGKPVRHILELTLGREVDSYQMPNLSDRRKNRLSLKQTFMKEAPEREWKMETDARPESAPALVFSGAILRKMNKLLILEENVRKVIFEAEQSGKRSYCPEDGYYTAYLLQGHVTFWVAYRPSADAFIIENVYLHRMCIEEA